MVKTGRIRNYNNSMNEKVTCFGNSRTNNVSKKRYFRQKYIRLGQFSIYIANIKYLYSSKPKIF